MNKHKLLYFLSFAILVATGCSKKFMEDMKSYDKYGETIFTNETQTGWYLDRMYYDFFYAYKSPTQTLVGVYNGDRSGMTEEIGGIGDWINPQKTLINASDASDYYGAPPSTGITNNSYSRIRNLNFLIDKINTVGAQSLSQSFRNTTRGQALVMRAMQYFDLMRVYGGVPIVTTVQNADAYDESIKLPRATPEEVVNQIVADLDTAANLLPARWDQVANANSWGRLSSVAALALKSRVLLTFASPLFNPDWDNAGNSRWQKALAAGLAAETAAKTAGYGLYGSTAKEWGQMTYANDNAFNPEAIIVQLLSSSNASSGINSNGWERSIRLTSQTGSGGVSVPLEMIDAFPMADGSRPVKGVNYATDTFFMKRDPRFYRTFAFSGCKWGTKESPDAVVWIYRWKYGAATSAVTYSDNNNTMSPVVVRKMSNPNASTSTGLAFSGTDIFEYRYAELLLNIAECYAATGDINSAVSYLEQIRKRVGIPAANHYGIGTLASRHAAIEACLYERRIELAYEGKRFWDLHRWMLYSDDASTGNTCTALGVTPLNGTKRTGKYWQYKTVTGGAASADPLASARTGISIDPDASTFQDQLVKLRTFYKDNLVLTDTDVPMDKDASSQPLTILFRPHYYISGLNASVLSNNTWLQQTKGWLDYSGVPGTFEYRK
ncbi:RagB/SusD family nutrient uptake outer membrane protein [Filimonas effusa]|uniref:RagB/SusD family nutrient uptake outer membrane protein n=1 Tax=Filimonas effusa TaxID=2508721 RepID=A0A4Q1DB95_9BACT|nr:RagB/SusD family nutrient uptake outer membrane protein [Filimonas effusa]RXK86724.1 RagB/SusD family nutrient uptake outer membrane protein [Filimonas effusa]